jgi:hypothetical protein
MSKKRKQKKGLKREAMRLGMTPKELGKRIMDSHARYHGYGAYAGHATKDRDTEPFGFIKGRTE